MRDHFAARVAADRVAVGGAVRATARNGALVQVADRAAEHRIVAAEPTGSSAEAPVDNAVAKPAATVGNAAVEQAGMIGNVAGDFGHAGSARDRAGL